MYVYMYLYIAIEVKRIPHSGWMKRRLDAVQDWGENKGIEGSQGASQHVSK